MSHRIAAALASLGLLASAALATGARAEEPPFDRWFTGATVRLDLFHTGHSQLEVISQDRVIIEGPWPGSRTQLLDTTNRGKYWFEVIDVASQSQLYSRGFASIYGEWETTAEARRGVIATYEESLRFPEPRAPVQIRLRKRNERQDFVEIWTTRVDPASRHVHRAAPRKAAVHDLVVTGPPESRVDLLILGDGYTAAQQPKFLADARRAADAMFAVEPYRARRNEFNVRALAPEAAESGISRPRAGIHRNNPLGSTYNFFDSERYVLSPDDRAIRDAAAAAPYDFLLLLVNERKYGGGGIYQLYATAAADSAYAPYLVVHEFGHSFAGLADEYYTSPIAYEELPTRSVEPWEPNATALLDPDHLKWKDLLTEGVALPTEWNKEEYETLSRQLQQDRAELRAAGAAEEVLEELFRKEQETFTRMLGASGQAGVVGAFEGCMYEAQGLYRPAADCIMFTRDDVGFCPPCHRAIEAIIDLYSR